MTTPPIRTMILLVDDVPENLVALTALLRSEELELHTAASAREALELLLRHEYALALVDVHMPEIDGFELAELMRGNQRTRSIPIIFVTADPHEPQRLFRGYDAGAVDFLFKPIEPRVLLRKVATFRELFEQKRQLRGQLADLERVTHQLQENLRLSETFVAALGHDLRTPLSTISFTLSLLDKLITDPGQRRAIERMSASSARMIDLIEQLYDVARIRLGGGLLLKQAPTDLVAVVQQIVREQAATRTDARLSVTVDGDCLGVWDSPRIARVVANLVGNALQHGDPAAGVTVALAGDDPTRVRLTVDNGGVVPEAVQLHIFEPFRRGTPEGSRGLGLGLYIVQQLVAAHGGSVTFTSSAHAGTRFVVELPRLGAATSAP